MSKKYFISVYLLIFSLAYSQREYPTNYGMKFGLNQTTIKGFQLDGAKTGYTAINLYGSFFMDTKIGSKTWLENEVLYSYTDNIHFIEIPIHFKHKIIKDLNIFYGPKLDFIINTSYALYNYKPATFSAEIGSQYFITNKLFLEARYSKGLLNQIDINFLDVYNGKRNNIRLGLGLKF